MMTDSTIVFVCLCVCDDVLDVYVYYAADFGACEIFCTNFQRFSLSRSLWRTRSLPLLVIGQCRF